MKISKITYSMLRMTGKFENDRTEVTVELSDDESVADAVRMAKTACMKALATDPDYAGYK